MPSPGRLAPQARPHALAELEVTLAKANAERDRYRQSVSRASDDDELRRTKALLRIAEQRLAHLCRSRDVLLVGEQVDDAEAEAKAS
jgi:hypothetical protein